MIGNFQTRNVKIEIYILPGSQKKPKYQWLFSVLAVLIVPGDPDVSESVCKSERERSQSYGGNLNFLDSPTDQDSEILEKKSYKYIIHTQSLDLMDLTECTVQAAKVGGPI